MKKIFLLLILFLFPLAALSDESMLDFDMNFIDNPFGNQKPVSQKQFDEVVNRMQAPRKGFIAKFKDFLGRNKPENDPALKNFKSDGVGELGMKAKDIENLKPYLMLSTPIRDAYGKTVPMGYYQISYSNKDNVKLINFMQGAKIYGSLKARDTRDDWDKNSVIYARMVYPSKDIAKVIFSNLDVCVEGYAQLIGNY